MVDAKKKQTKRQYVCAECKNEIVLSEDNIYGIIHYDSCNYHSGCFKQMCTRKASNKIAKPCWAYALEHLDEITHESKTYYENLYTRDILNKFLLNHYDLEFVPPKFWTRLADVNNGSYKNIGVPIPTSDILTMWKIKLHTLDGIAESNKIHGNQMAAQDRLIYDLAILVNKYNSFCEWREKQKILEASEKIERKQSDRLIINQIVLPQETTKKKDDILDMVDEIFD